jgi:protoporphyrinogen oxidase
MIEAPDAQAGRAVQIVGGGIAGLAAAIELGDRATVFEAESRAGGLVRTEAIDVPGIGRFWFDHVVHMLHFQDAAVAARVRAIVGDALVRCDPRAYVETLHGPTHYPLQTNLADLPPAWRDRCLAEFVAAHAEAGAAPANFEEALLRTFGRGMCDLFLLPHNRKVWGRPLDSLRGRLGWTITQPPVEQVMKGAQDPTPLLSAYNADGWYPRPPADADCRGMEVLTRSLAARVTDLRTRHRVTGVDPAARSIALSTPDGALTQSYRSCIATLPLTQMIAACAGVPASLRGKVARLRHNRAWTIVLCVRGGMQANAGHWRYYADESICFTRLVFMNAFDPGAAPPGCWGLMAEITEPSEHPPGPTADRIARVLEDARRVGIVTPAAEIVGADAWIIDHAYVAFTESTEEIVAEATAWLQAEEIHPLGRYGRWEYSSMAQVLGEAFALGARLRARL